MEQTRKVGINFPKKFWMQLKKQALKEDVRLGKMIIRMLEERYKEIKNNEKNDLTDEND